MAFPKKQLQRIKLQQLTLASWDIHNVHNLLGHIGATLRNHISADSQKALNVAISRLDTVAAEVSALKMHAENDADEAS